MNQHIPPDISQDDVWQWLNRGWFLYEREDGTRIPAMLLQVDRHEYAVEDIEQNEWSYCHDRIFPYWPKCGALNLQGYAVVLERQSERQYRRTYNARCLSVKIPRKWDIMKQHPSCRSLGPDNKEIVRAAFSPEYCSYTGALKRLESGWISVALTPFVIIAGKPDEHFVYYRGELVAQIVKGTLMPYKNAHRTMRRILKLLEGKVTYEST